VNKVTDTEPKKLNLSEIVAIGVGGMVGGGIFSVLGLSASIAGHASFISFLFGGIIALLTGFSYAYLGLKYRSEGGSFTYLEKAFSNQNVAAIGGWLLIVGYLGTLSLYAYTFGAYGGSMIASAGTKEFIIWQHILATFVILVFMGINLRGAKVTGTTELIIVAIKVAILAFFSLIALTSIKRELVFPIFNTGFTNVVIASALIFVAYEGFELIPNAINEIEEPDKNLKRGIIYSIIITATIYMAVAFVAVGNLTPAQINQYKEYALAVAAETKLHQFGFTLIVIAALFSTSSAINATLFGTARLMYDMATERDLPKSFALKDRRKGVPFVSLLVIGFLSILFVNLSDLSEIASFASVTFLVIFSMINLSAIKLRKEIGIYWFWPLIGLILSTFSLIVLLIYLYKQSIMSFYYITVIYIIVIFIELFLSKRKIIGKQA